MNTIEKKNSLLGFTNTHMVLCCIIVILSVSVFIGAIPSVKAVPPVSISLWNYTTASSLVPVIYSNGFLYTMDGTTLKCRTSISGVEVWSRTVANTIWSVSEVYGTYIYLVTHNSNEATIRAIDITDGSGDWSYTPPDYALYKNVYGYIDVDIINHRLYFGCANTFFYCIDSITGAFIWKYDSPSRIDSTSTFSNAFVYFRVGNGFMYALHADTGVYEWKSNIEMTHDTYGKPHISTDGDWLYTTNDIHNSLNVINIDTGVNAWHYDLLGATVTCDVSFIEVEDGLIYLNSSETLYCINEAGTLQWQTAISTSISSPYLNGGTYVYYAEYDTVHALNKVTGVEYWNRFVVHSGITRPSTDNLRTWVSSTYHGVYAYVLSYPNPVPSLNYISINGVYMNETDNFNFWLFRADVYEMVASATNTDDITITLPDTMHTMVFSYDSSLNSGKVTVTGFNDPNQNMNVIGLASSSWNIGLGVNETWKSVV